MNEKREIFGWSMYDWANSAFSTTVITAFLGRYLAGLINAQVGVEKAGVFYLLGIPIVAESFFTYCVSVSVLLQVFFLPILGAIADYSRLKKRMLMLFATVGALLTIALFFIEGNLYVLGGLLFIVANLAFGASVVFYNAFLPQIASPDQRDRVSSFGWALGYLGGGLLLLLNLVLFLLAPSIGLNRALAARISIASAGVWWLVFGLFAFSRLRERGAQRALPPGANYVGVGFKQLSATLREIRKYPTTLRYLLAYLIYNDGIQTVIVVSTLFGETELKMADTELLLLLLMVQGVAFLGALLFGRIAGRLGTKRAIIFSLLIWSAVSVWAQVSLQSKTEFWLLGAVVALVLGGSQALSRSLFSQMIPREKEAEFFSFYEISDRGTAWTGTALFGLVYQLTGSMRTAVFSLIVLFVSGLIVLTTVNVRRAVRESGNDETAIESAPAAA
ncbi:MAG TPA: MFS transporter [Anaerolineae bacterium]